MSLCLLQVNQCSFANCGLHFANKYDLIAHVEYTHIPLIEEDMKRKTLQSSNGTTEEKSTAAANMPLSIMSRVFRTAYRPNPIRPEPLKVSFNHYKRRILKEQAALRMQQQQQAQQHQQQQQQQHQQQHQHHQQSYHQMRFANHGHHDEEPKRTINEHDIEECHPNDPETRYRCHLVDCQKRYKNYIGLRIHMKTSHNITIGEEVHNSGGNDDGRNLQKMQNNVNIQQPSIQIQGVSDGGALANSLQISAGSALVAAMNNASGPLQLTPNTPIGQVVGLTTMSSPSKPHKCTHCNKRYKTHTGLANHLMTTHQKHSPTPAVVEQLISHVRMQHRQQEQPGTNGQLNQPSPQQRSLNMPVSLAVTTPAVQQQLQQNQNFNTGNNNASNNGPSQSVPIPGSGPHHVRSFTVTTTSQPLRFSGPHMPTTLSTQTRPSTMPNQIRNVEGTYTVVQHGNKNVVVEQKGALSMQHSQGTPQSIQPQQQGTPHTVNQYQQQQGPVQHAQQPVQQLQQNPQQLATSQSIQLPQQQESVESIQQPQLQQQLIQQGQSQTVQQQSQQNAQPLPKGPSQSMQQQLQPQQEPSPQTFQQQQQPMPLGPSQTPQLLPQQSVQQKLQPLVQQLPQAQPQQQLLQSQPQQEQLPPQPQIQQLQQSQQDPQPQQIDQQQIAASQSFANS
ncbi:unnamed protein product [Caenorhabditis bovis]|uniref:C2H2-type domain-containing protein n=1 Tax=Caenorhabditis bovis TaxID=2654633 RepID=A0A8S1F825_9PELO|nr:unnamed protein product [Caenorhabditis bovis]